MDEPNIPWVCSRMFGFLPAPCGCFTADERGAWRAHFCGLGNALRQHYGLWTRLLVNRDAAFLSLIGSSLSPGPPRMQTATCCNPLGPALPLVQAAPQARYAAALTVLALSIKLRDDADDEPGIRGRAARAAHRCMEGALATAVKALQSFAFPVAEVLELLGSQTRRETAAGCSLEAATAPTRLAYGHILAHLPQVTRSAPEHDGPLRALGENLGTLIYLTDAVEDHAEDLKHGRFNPLPSDAVSRHETVCATAGQCLEGIRTAAAALPLQSSLLPLTRRLLLLTLPASVGRRLHLPVVMHDPLKPHGFRPPPSPPPENPGPRRGCMHFCCGFDCQDCDGCCDGISCLDWCDVCGCCCECGGVCG